MANTLMSLLVKLGLDSKEYNSGMDQAEGKAKGLGGTLATIGKVGLGGLLAVGGAAVAAGAALATTIKPASDLAETVNKVSVVFGESSGAVLAFGQNSATAMGMSQNAALSAAGTYGNLFTSMGMDTTAAADMSMNIVKLAGDLASFNNISPEEALEKLRAGLVGETEPLRSLGVNLSAAAVEAKALSMGLGSTTVDMLKVQDATIDLAKATKEADKMTRWYGKDNLKTQEAVLKQAKAQQALEEALAGGKVELTAAEKAQASYALIMEQTTNAQGDFSRTSEGLANQQRIIAAQFEDIKAKVGTALLPLMTTLSSELSTLFSDPAFQTGLQNFIAGLSAAAAWMITNIPVAISTLVSFWNGQLLPAIQAGIAWFQTNLLPALSQIFGWLSVNIPLAITTASAFFSTVLLPALQAVWNFLAPVLVPLFNLWAQGMMVTIPTAIMTLVTFWTGTLWPALQVVFGWITANLVPLLLAIANLLSAVVGVAVTALAGLFQNVLAPAIQAAWSWLKEKMEPALNAIKPYLEKASGLAGGLAGAFDGVSSAIQGAISWINDLANNLRNLQLPSWLTPGSPTPWEMGLRGVSSAMKTLSRAALPQLEAALDLRAPAAVQGAGGSAAPTSVTYNIFSKEQPGQISNALSIAQLLGGAA